MTYTVDGHPSDDYRRSDCAIQATCECHPVVITLFGDRCGLHGVKAPFRPVYRLRSRMHPEVSATLWVLHGGRLLPLVEAGSEGEGVEG